MPVRGWVFDGQSAIPETPAPDRIGRKQVGQLWFTARLPSKKEAKLPVLMLRGRVAMAAPGNRISPSNSQKVWMVAEEGFEPPTQGL